MFVVGQKPGPGRPKGALNKNTTLKEQARLLAKELVTNKHYLAQLKKDLKTRNVDSAIERMLWNYAYGMPRETVDVTWQLEKLSDRELLQLESLVKRAS